MQRHTETLRGNGILTAPDGTRREVSYVLRFYQDMISVGNQDRPNAAIPGGLLEIRGEITPACFVDQNGVTLRTQDGRIFGLVFDSAGKVTATPAG